MGNTCSNYRKENDQEIVFASQDTVNYSFLEDKFKIPANLHKVIKLQKLFRKNRRHHVKAAHSTYLGEPNSIPDSFIKAKTDLHIKQLSNLFSIIKTVDISIDSYRATNKNLIQTEEFSSIKNSIYERQFETEKFTKTFENFFISNCYRSTKHARNYSIPICMTLSSPTKEKSCENLVEKILYTEREKTQYLQIELRKAILLMKVFNNKDEKIKLLYKRTYFRILKEKSKNNFLLIKQEGIKKIQTIKLVKIKNILSRLLDKKVFKCYEIWKINVISISNKRSIATKIIKNFLIFTNKYNLQKFFQIWLNKTKIQVSKVENMNKLKNIIVSKVFIHYSIKRNNEYRREAFNRMKSNFLSYKVKVKQV
jgi:hypothetical protein